MRSSLLVLAADVKSGEGVPLKRSLAARLGRVVDEEEPLMPPNKGEYQDTSRIVHLYSLNTTCSPLLQIMLMMEVILMFFHIHAVTI